MVQVRDWIGLCTNFGNFRLSNSALLPVADPMCHNS